MRNTCILDNNTKEISLLCNISFYVLSLSAILLIFFPPKFVLCEKTIKYFLICLMTVINILNCSKIIKNKNSGIIILLTGFFCLLTLASGIVGVNNVDSRNTFLASIVFCAILMNGVLFLAYLSEMKLVNKFLKLFFYFGIFILIINDVLLPFSNFENMTGNIYFLGNKFNVTYAHLLIICLTWYLFKNKKRIKLIIFFLLVYSVILMIIMRSSTGIVGCIMMFFFLIIPNRIVFKIHSLKFVLLLIFVSFLFIFLASPLLNLKFVQFFIVDIFGEDLTLSARTNIFKVVPSLFLNSPFFGYGYGSINEILINLTGCFNTQNGLWELLVTFGLPATLIYLFLICLPYAKKDGNQEIFPLMIYSIILIVLSSIEVTYGNQFVLISILLFLVKKENQCDKQKTCVLDYNAQS